MDLKVISRSTTYIITGEEKLSILKLMLNLFFVQQYDNFKHLETLRLNLLAIHHFVKLFKSY